MGVHFRVKERIIADETFNGVEIACGVGVGLLKSGASVKSGAVSGQQSVRESGSCS
jgi:hypothetical protein